MVRRQRSQRLQQQRALADAGVAADQHHAAGDQAAAKRAVELADAGGDAVGFACPRCRTRSAVGWPASVTGSAGRRRLLLDGFNEGVPQTAAGALPLPFRRRGAALGTGMDGFDLLMVCGAYNRPRLERTNPNHEP